jgi:cytochrome P450
MQKEDEKNPSGGYVEFTPWLSRATLDIIGIAGVDFDFNAIEDPNTELSRTYRTIFVQTNQARILQLLGLIFPIRLLRLIPAKRNSDIRNASKTIRRISRELIEQKQRKLAEKGASTGKDILSVALKSGGFTVENLVDQTMTFLAAGHETTATASQWAIYELCRHPEIQGRLREEVRANLPSPDDENATVSAEMLDRLPYLHAVCSETLRLHPPVRITRRETAKDTTILGQFIPKGSDIVICPLAINRSKAIWGEDAQEFNPERWMGPGRVNSGGAESVYAQVTFLHGMNNFLCALHINCNLI